MLLSILKENLKHGLTIVSHIASKSVNLPILSNILISVKKEGIKLIATNLEIGVTQNIRGKVESESEFTIDSKIFLDYINLLPNKKINLFKESNDLKIECDNYKTKIRTESSEDFPLIPKINKNNKITISISEFKKSLSQVVFAVSSNEARIELSGVLLTVFKDKMIIASTDSYRLAEKTVKIKQQTEDENSLSIIVPAKTIQEIIRVISSVTDNSQIKELDLYIDENQILFIMDSIEIVSRLIDGQYPDYKQIIPETSKTSAIVDRGELIRAVKASALFSKTGINDINLDFPAGKNQVIVSSTSGSTGENIVEIEAETKGIDNGMIINYQYLLDGLNNINDDKIKIEIIDNNTPCILKSIKDSNYLYIIMPIKQ